MPTTNDCDPRPLHPLKRSQKVRLRKWLEKQNTKEAKFLYELRFGKRLK